MTGEAQVQHEQALSQTPGYDPTGLEQIHATAFPSILVSQSTCAQCLAVWSPDIILCLLAKLVQNPACIVKYTEELLELFLTAWLTLQVLQPPLLCEGVVCQAGSTDLMSSAELCMCNSF